MPPISWAEFNMTDRAAGADTDFVGQAGRSTRVSTGMPLTEASLRASAVWTATALSERALPSSRPY
ncbi:hypothetical protein [Streptomyces canus]|uniref:hypothetical protein n=1 Tax=Streptomyces canus TaxID=58343 RepID=UPI0036E73C62